MNKNLKTICATIAISLLPMGTVCYAQTATNASYETIWVDAASKVEEQSVEKSKKTSAEEYSIEDVLRFKSDKEKYDAYMGKEVTVKLKVCKLKVADDQSYIMSKDSSMKKAKCVTSKEEANKCKEGDEVIVVGTLKEIKGNKVLLENAKVIKVIDVNNKEYNKDKYKEKDKKDDKCENQKDKCEDKKDKCDKDKKEDAKVEEKTSAENKDSRDDKKADSKIKDKKAKNEKAQEKQEEKNDTKTEKIEQ
ncbi:MAG: hypothetical protein ACRDCW_00155 [Sarcina sp.]